METTTLGRTGIEISKIGLGAWALGGKSYGAVSHQDAFAALETYLEKGNFIDTARGYNESEMLIGQYLKERNCRDQVIIASKTPKHTEEEIRDHLHTSLTQLQTDYLDLYYLHSPPEDEETMNRVLDVFFALKEEGKIRAIGASIKGPNVTDNTLAIARRYIADGRTDAFQMIYSVLRQKNQAVFEEAQQAGIAIVARTILESGFLSGHYDPKKPFPEGDHRNRWSQEVRSTINAGIAHVAELNENLPYASVKELAMRFAYEESGVTAIIPGGKNAPQITENNCVAELPSIPEATKQELKTYFEKLNNTFNPS